MEWESPKCSDRKGTITWTHTQEAGKVGVEVTVSSDKFPLGTSNKAAE